MKNLIFAMLFFSSSVFAVDFCSYQETYEFFDELDALQVSHVKKSRNHKRFTFLEKNLIHLALSTDAAYRGISREEALEQFGDFNEFGEPGSNAGEILYYEIEGKKFVLVHYWPGDNEYGAYFELKKGGGFKLIGRINDSFIECH